MNDHIENRDVKVVAIDLAKKSFQLHGVDAHGHKIVGKKLTRNKLKIFMVKLPPGLVVMESCIGAHYCSDFLALIDLTRPSGIVRSFT